MKNAPPRNVPFSSTPASFSTHRTESSESKWIPIRFQGQVTIADTLMFRLKGGHPVPGLNPRMASLVRAFTRAMAERACNPAQSGPFGGPLRFEVWFDAEHLPAVATVSSENKKMVTLDIAGCASN